VKSCSFWVRSANYTKIDHGENSSVAICLRIKAIGGHALNQPATISYEATSNSPSGGGIEYDEGAIG